MATEYIILKILVSDFALQFRSDDKGFNEILIQKELKVNKCFMTKFHKRDYVSANMPEVKRVAMNGLLVCLIYYLRKLNLTLSDRLPGDDVNFHCQALDDFYSLIEKLEYSSVLI